MICRTPAIYKVPGCKAVSNAKCILYTGSNLTCLGVLTNDRLDDVLIKINDAVCSLESITLAPIGSSPNIYGATLDGNALNLEPASVSFGGIITSGIQSFGGAKTFEELLINTTDQGDYTFQTTGGFYADTTGKNLKLVGISTDNSSSSLYGIDASGNVVLRTVGSLPAGGGGSTVNQSTFSGTGLLTSFQIAHGEAGIPKFIIQPATQDASGYLYATADATNITVFYNIAPPLGVNNVVINWIANL